MRPAQSVPFTQADRTADGPDCAGTQTSADERGKRSRLRVLSVYPRPIFEMYGGEYSRKFTSSYLEEDGGEL
jgi:hypothetical protein